MVMLASFNFIEPSIVSQAIGVCTGIAIIIVLLFLRSPLIGFLVGGISWAGIAAIVFNTGDPLAPIVQVIVGVIFGTIGAVLGLAGGLLGKFVRRIIDRKLSPNACPSCDYDLTGNTTGVCPECGHASETKATA